ncbi:MAG: hypothetical protein L3J22_08870 [Xanthomonadales bacterium]|nr:hypothetical protein [Xanthomonadales bacterium]
MKKPNILKQIFCCIILLYVMAAWVGCDLKYTGDGHLIDNGFRSADRFILNLGKINLNQKKSYKFKLKNLPTETFVIGFSFVFENPTEVYHQQPELRPNNAVVSFKLMDDDKVITTLNNKKIHSLTWSQPAKDKSGAFVYSRNHSYFLPDNSKEYILILDVNMQNTKKEQMSTVELVLTGGGWK